MASDAAGKRRRRRLVIAVAIVVAGLLATVQSPGSPLRRPWLNRLPDAALRWEAAAHPGEPWPHYLLGMRLARKGQFRAALRALDESRRRAPREILPILGAAELWMNAGRPAEALIEARRATERDPRSALAQRVFGALALDAGDTARARESLETATRLDATDADAWFHLGRLRNQEQGEGASARAALERAVALDAEHAEAHRELALVLIRAGAFPEAERHARTAQRLDPADPMGHAALGVVLHRHEPTPARLADAEQSLRHALSLDAEFAPAHYELGALLADRGDWPAARRSLETATRLGPLNQGAWHRLALVYERMALPSAAERARRRFRELAETQPGIALASSELSRRPRDVAPRLTLARLHRRRGEWGAAAEQLRQVLALQPGHAAALRAMAALEREGRIRRATATP